MKQQFLASAIVLAVFAMVGCGGGGSSSPVPNAAPVAVSLAAQSNSVCVPAQSTAQVVNLPDTGGITATLNLAQYDAGTTGCQNVTIATGASAAAAASAARGGVAGTTRRTEGAAPGPLLSITLGQGLSSNLGLTTVFTGATLKTDANIVFPDGTYLATVTYTLLGQPITVSLVFTAKNGVLTITGGEGLPIILGSGATILLYDRGVTPPGFELATPTPAPTPTSNATPSPSPAPTAPPGGTTFGFPPPAGGTTIGSFSYTYGGTCPPGYPFACSASPTPLVQQVGPPDGQALIPAFNSLPIFFGTVTLTYNLGNFIPASMTTACPSNYIVSAGSGSMTVTIPPPPSGQANSGCTVTFTTLPPGGSGSFYAQTVGF